MRFVSHDGLAACFDFQIRSKRTVSPFCEFVFMYFVCTAAAADPSAIAAKGDEIVFHMSADKQR